MAAVFAVSFANAQDSKGGSSDMKFGVKAGLNNSNYTGDADGGDAATSFYIGGLVDFTVSEKFHVQPELLYSVEGADKDSMTFLRLPIMAKYYVAEGFSLQAGPEFAFKIAAENDLTDEFTKSLDYGLGIGAGYELESGLFFDARYNLGLANISDVDGFDAGTTSIQVGLGYRF
ncbi:MAG: PorT family protein [Flavobacterium sp.]|nr:PorT family protein [Flavobacterium sp.]